MVEIDTINDIIEFGGSFDTTEIGTIIRVPDSVSKYDAMVISQLSIIVNGMGNDAVIYDGVDGEILILIDVSYEAIQKAIGENSEQV